MAVSAVSHQAVSHHAVGVSNAAPPNDARTLLIENHLSLARRLTRTFRNKGVDTEDLEQVARLGLVKAADGYDPEHGAFAPFAAATIRGELKRYFRDLAWDVRIPRRLQELQARITADAAEHPQDQEAETVALRLGEEVADVREALAASGCFTTDSTEAAQDAGHELGGQADDRFEAVDDWVTFCDLNRELSRADRQLLQWRYLDEMTQREMGVELGISQMQVSRRLSTLVRRLRERVGVDVAA